MKKKSENYYILNAFGIICAALTIYLLFGDIPSGFPKWPMIGGAAAGASFFFKIAEKRK